MFMPFVKSIGRAFNVHELMVQVALSKECGKNFTSMAIQHMKQAITRRGF